MKAVFISLLAVGLVGCSPKEKQSVVEQPDPVSELRGIIDEAKGILPGDCYGWDYDVKKSDSIVKPYTGTVSWRMRLTPGPYLEEVHFLCYQEGRWKATGSKHHFPDSEWTEVEVSVLNPVIKSFYADKHSQGNKP
jgi:hypothetical protein